jgi:hypothetical protein
VLYQPGSDTSILAGAHLTNAIKVQTVVIIALFAVVAVHGVQRTYFLWGLTLTLGLIAVYCTVAVGVFRH